MKTPEEYYKVYLEQMEEIYHPNITHSKKILTELFKDAQTEAYNQAIRDAAENAEVTEKLSNPYDLHLVVYYVVDEQSILKLLK